MHKLKARKDDQLYIIRATLDKVVSPTIYWGETNARIADDPGESWREVAVLGRHSLYDLAEVIVRAFDFRFEHSCAFFYPHTAFWKTGDPEELYEMPLRAEEAGALNPPSAQNSEKTAQDSMAVLVQEVFREKGKTLGFLFDYGDNWNFTVETQEVQPADNRWYPKTVGAEGPAPLQYPPAEETMQSLDELSDEELDEVLEDDCPLCRFEKERIKAERAGKERPGGKGGNILEAFAEAAKMAAGRDDMVAGIDPEAEREFMESQGFMAIDESVPLEKVLGCGWRRVRCGKDDCFFCTRVAAEQERLREQGEGGELDGTFMPVLEDEAPYFGEAIAAIQEDAARRGIEIENIDELRAPPKPEAFPLYHRIAAWKESIRELAEQADARHEFWMFTEDAADLFWYADMLSAKAYRQLCNRWFEKERVPHGDFDAAYTGRVLVECIEILKGAFDKLTEHESPSQKALRQARDELSELEAELASL